MYCLNNYCFVFFYICYTSHYNKRLLTYLLKAYQLSIRSKFGKTLLMTFELHNNSHSVYHTAFKCDFITDFNEKCIIVKGVVIPLLVSTEKVMKRVNITLSMT